MIRCTGLAKHYPQGRARKQVLAGLDLVVRPGQRLGILGRNGAGKTTLIKLIGGVELPSSGVVERQMSLSWPLGFGGGFQGSLTGFDNARFIARIYGRDYADIRGFVEDFSELGRQLAMPVKTYSAGMKARLAFALSLAIEFDCYLIDEVIMVGDQNFQRKCMAELFEKRADRALILASHAPEMIRRLCDSALLLEGGHGRLFADVEEGLAAYEAL
ncbi:MAG TPA: ABC transporter ATP-binding protein [Novosphingobium sp.]|nr:ABC transporter ATP-binding protein [Novosphingobium sp.]HZV10010.1 ABC transporter ATP-binding protein [Novosphingobium sp.]